MQVPNFTNTMLNRVAQGDMSILDEEHDFTFTECANYGIENWNALRVASAKGYLNLVNRLLEIDEVRASAEAERNFALRWAAKNGHLDVVNRLLEIDEVKASSAACLALMKAAGSGYLEVVNRLLDIPVVRTNAGAWDNEALRLAAANGHLKVVNRLLEIHVVSANAAADHNVALQDAARNGHLDVVNRLLEIDAVRADVTARDNWALGSAGGGGHLDVVNRLLEIDAVRANVAGYNNSALREVVEFSNAEGGALLDVVNRLLEIDAVSENVGAEDNEVLYWAVESGYFEVVHVLAKAQWPLGKQDMPEGMHRYLPMIKAGAQLYTAKIEQERILISALQKKRVVSTKRLYAPSPSGFDPLAHRLFTLPGDVVDSIANYVGYKKQYLADQIRKDDWQNAWNDMRRSERLYGLFTEINRRATRALRL